MICIFCGSETEVTNSRPNSSTPTVWRRRRCKACVAQFSTQELPDLSKALKVGSPDNKQSRPFERDKLFVSVHRALLHRSDALQSATALTATIMRHILKKQRALTASFVVPRGRIARIAIQALKRYDPLAAATYKAYHQAALKED